MQEGGYKINLAVASSSKEPLTAKVWMITGNELRCYAIEVFHDNEARLARLAGMEFVY